MDHVFENVVDILVAIVVMFLFPLLYFGQRQDTIIQNAIYMNTSKLFDTVSTKGYLSKDMYETYLKCLDNAHVLGDIHFEHKELALEPEYRFKTSDEVINEQNAAFGGINVYTYIPVTTEIPYVVDPIDNSGLVMNTETNASIIANSVNLPASPSHVHTDACYDGIKHNHSAYGGSCYSSYSNSEWVSHTHSSTCYHTHKGSCYGSCNGDMVFGNGGYFYTTCSICRRRIQALTYYIFCSYGCGHTSSQTWYSCGHGSSVPSVTRCGATVLTCSLSTSEPICGLGSGYWSTSTSYTLSCGKIEGAYYKGNTCVYPSCNTIINSIAPTHMNQVLYLNDPLITTVTVTYKDGSTKTVVATANFIPNTIVQNKIVTLSYGGFTKNILVTVIPKTKTCVYGHTYNLNSDGIDPGCCYCNSWLSSLDVIYPTTKEITIYKGTTLEENGVVLLATYLNGNTETLYSGYANNLDTNYVGTQTVTLSYKGKYTSLKVITKRNLVQCSKCSRFYELYPDESNPGCPYCTARIPVFTGNVLKHYTNYYTNEILKELMEGSGVYYFKEGDYFNIQVTNKTKTFGTKLISTVIPNVSTTGIKVEYSGEIRDESRLKE